MLDNRYFNDNFVAGLLMDIYFPCLKYFLIAGLEWNIYLLTDILNNNFVAGLLMDIYFAEINFFICLITDILMTILLHVS